MYAIIATGGKQYKVQPGDVINVEKLAVQKDEKVVLDVLMTVDGNTVTTGKDVTAKATCKVLAQGKDKKIVVFKYKAKKNERKKQGHRQPFTRLLVENIG